MKIQLILFIILMMLIISGFFGCIEKTELSIEYFRIQPTIIKKGETANISWNVTGATEVFIDNDIGKVNLHDTIMINPELNTTYTLFAISSDKTINSNVTITVEIIKKENEKETPIVNMSAESYNDNNSVLIEIKSISIIGTEWSTALGKIINDENGENIFFISMEWKPNGMITERDEIIITNSMLKEKFIPGNKYTFLLSYQLTNKIMGKVSWIQ